MSSQHDPCLITKKWHKVVFFKKKKAMKKKRVQVQKALLLPFYFGVKVISSMG